MKTSAHELLAIQFKTELSKIHTNHTSRKARLAQLTLEYIEFAHITAPAIAQQCKKIMVDANPYSGEYWRAKGISDNSLSLNSTLVN